MSTQAHLIERLIALEALQQGVNPRLAVEVGRAESRFNPTARSPQEAYGPMQLMPDTAARLGVDRYDPYQNIQGGVTLLRDLERRYPGDTARQLAAYNAGQRAVERYGGVPPYPETQGFVGKVMASLGPRSAEAAEAAPAPSMDRAAMEQRLRQLEQLERRETAPGGAPTAAPMDRAWMEQRLQQLEQLRTQETAPQMAPGAPAPGTPATLPEVSLPPPTPGIARIKMDIEPLPPTAPGVVAPGPPPIPPTAGGGGAPSLSTNPMSPGVVAPGPPATPPTAGGGGAPSLPANQMSPGVVAPGPPPIPPTAPAAAGAPGLDPVRAELLQMAPLRPFPSGVPSTPPFALAQPTIRDPALARAEARTPLQKVGDVGKEAAATAIDIGLTMGGGAAGAFVGTPTGPGAVIPASVGAATGSLAAQRINEYLGFRDPSGVSDALAVLLPLLPMVPPALKGVLAKTPAGRALLQTYDDFAKQRQAYQEALNTRPSPLTTEKSEQARTVEALRQERAERRYQGRVAAEEEKAATATTAQRTAYEEKVAAETQRVAEANQTRVAEHAQKVADAQAAADEATRRAEALRQTKHAEEYEVAAAKARERIATYKQEVAEYNTAVEKQAGAVKEIGEIPGRFLPQMPEGIPAPAAGGRPVDPLHAVSRRLYAHLDEVAPNAPVRMGSARERMQELLPELEPLTQVVPGASKIKEIAAAVDKLGDTTTVKEINNLLKDLGPLSSSSSGKVRYAAMQASDALHDAVIRTGRELPETAYAGKVMDQARGAWRREKAVETLSDAFHVGGTVVERDAQGRTVVNVKAALNQLERIMHRNRFFAGSFTPEELTDMRRMVEGLIGTPQIPRQRPPVPQSVQMKDLGAPPPPVVPKEVPPPQLMQMKDLGAPPPPVTPRAVPRPEPSLSTPPGMSLPPVPERAEPTLPTWTIPWKTGLSAGGGYTFAGGDPAIAAMIAGGLAVSQVVSYVISKALLTPSLRPMLKWSLDPQGQISVKNLTALAVAGGFLGREEGPAFEAYMRDQTHQQQERQRRYGRRQWQSPQ
jgi:hypothetical protein